jgi:O-antigen/teichoic acid export membrane protein
MRAKQTSLKKTIAVNALANWGDMAAHLAVTFCLTPILIHSLGEQRYGIWSLAESIIAYLTLFDLGVAASVVRFAARFESLNDHDRLNRMVSTSLALFAGAGMAVMLSAVGLLAGGWPWSTIPAELVGEARAVLLLLALNLSLCLPLGVFPSLLDGLQHFAARAGIRTGMLLTRAVAFVIIIRRGYGLVELITATLTVNLVEQAILALMCWLVLPSLRISPKLVDRETFGLIRGYSVGAFLMMIAGRIAFQTDALVIGMFLAPQYIAYFAVGARLVEYAKGLLTSLTGVLTPVISQLDARGDSAGIMRLFLNSARIATWILAPVVAGLVTLGRPFLVLWVGPSFAEQCYPVLVILALSLVLMAAQSTSARIFYGVGRLGRLARMALIQAFANLALSLLLVRPFGIQGVAWGTTIPFVIFCIVSISDVSWLCQVRPLHAFRSILVKPLGTALVLGAGWQLLVGMGAITSWTRFLLTGAIGTLGYAMAAIKFEFGLGIFSRGRGVATDANPKKDAVEYVSW